MAIDAEYHTLLNGQVEVKSTSVRVWRRAGATHVARRAKSGTQSPVTPFDMAKCWKQRQKCERDLPMCGGVPFAGGKTGRRARRVVRMEGIQVDAISSCGHHDSTEMGCAVIAKLVPAVPANR